MKKNDSITNSKYDIIINKIVKKDYYLIKLKILFFIILYNIFYLL